MPATFKKPIVITIDLTKGPTDEELRLRAADLVLRTLALVKKKETKKAITRLTSLNAIYRDYTNVFSNFKEVGVFIEYGRYYCSNPSKIKKKALLMLSLKAEPALNKLFLNLDKFIKNYKEENEMSSAIDTADEMIKSGHNHMHLLGEGIDALRKIMPRVIESQERSSGKEASDLAEELSTDKEYEVISREDVYVLQQAGEAKVKELGMTQNSIIRASVILISASVAEMTRRKVTIEYGMQRVLGSYLIMTEALVIGITRQDEFGNYKSVDDIKNQAQQILTMRNRVRAVKGQPPLALIQSTGITGRKKARHEVVRDGIVNTATHSYMLLFDEAYVLSGEFSCSKWEFYRKPGDATVHLTGN